MKLLYMTLFRCDEDSNPIRLVNTEDLTSFSFFQRNVVREQLAFATRTLAQRTQKGTRQTISMKDLPLLLHVHQQTDGLCGCLIADEEYPERVAFTFIAKALRDLKAKFGESIKSIKADTELDLPSLGSDFTSYQNPMEADKILKIQKNLDDVKDIMHKNIDEVLKRGETLDSLMQKSDDLSNMSYNFYKTAKRQNQCCKMY